MGRRFRRTCWRRRIESSSKGHAVHLHFRTMERSGKRDCDSFDRWKAAAIQSENPIGFNSSPKTVGEIYINVQLCSMNEKSWLHVLSFLIRQSKSNNQIRRFIMQSTIFLFAAVALLFNLRVAWAQEKLGKVDFPISCSPEAQTQFNRAVAMLHSFWFPQAPKAFASVGETDPNCAMAHWGIAISQRANPLVGPPDAAALKRGLASIERAKTIGAKTQRERDYINALELFYKDSDKLDHRTRVLAY